MERTIVTIQGVHGRGTGLPGQRAHGHEQHLTPLGMVPGAATSAVLEALARLLGREPRLFEEYPCG